MIVASVGFAVTAVLFVMMLSYSFRLAGEGAPQPNLATGQVAPIRNKGTTVYVRQDEVTRLYVLVGANMVLTLASTGLLVASRRRR